MEEAAAVLSDLEHKKGSSQDDEKLKYITSFDIPEAKFNYNFWICTYPNFESALYVNSRKLIENDQIDLKSFEELGTERLTLAFYDADGSLFNRAEVEFPTQEFLCLKLETMMSRCKLQSGMKHARLKVSSASDLNVVLRLYAKDTNQVLEPIRFVDKYKPDFFSVTFAADRMSYLAVTNTSDQEVDFRIKLFCCVNGLDKKLRIPASGARIFEVASLFPEIMELKEQRSFPAYLRVTSKSAAAIGLQFYEQRIF